jgi:hypothetical protein
MIVDISPSRHRLGLMSFGVDRRTRYAAAGADVRQVSAVNLSDWGSERFNKSWIYHFFCDQIILVWWLLN